MMILWAIAYLACGCLTLFLAALVDRILSGHWPDPSEGVVAIFACWPICLPVTLLVLGFMGFTELTAYMWRSRNEF